jgi:hypothetical protein
MPANSCTASVTHNTGLTLDMTPKEHEKHVLGPIMEKPKTFQTPEEAGDLGKRIR